MPPKTPEPSSGDLFRMALATIIDQNHTLVRLVRRIDRARFDEAFGAFYDNQKGRAGLPTRLMAGLHLLKHMKGLLDEQVCAVWLENPYFQAFCGADYFQHERPFDRASMTRWRQRIGAKALECLLAETIAVAAKTEAVSSRQLARVTVDSPCREILMTATRLAHIWQPDRPD
jgi:IS5 family transposase